MARHSNGRLMGMAASIDLRDFREYLATQQAKEIQRKRIVIDGLMTTCKLQEGDVFCTWWDDELPARIPQDQQIRLLTERIEGYKKGEQS